MKNVMNILTEIDKTRDERIQASIDSMPKRSNKITVTPAYRVGAEWMATATNGVDYYHSTGPTADIAEQRALNALKSVLSK